MTEPARAGSAELPRSSSSVTREILGSSRTLLAHPELRVVLACSMVLGLGASFVMPFLSLFATTEVGMTLREFGWFMTASTVANIAISTAIAQRSDTRYTRRTLLLVGSAAGALAYVGYAILRDVWALLAVASVVLGVASVTYSQLFAYARNLVDRSDMPRENAPLYLSTIRMCFALSWTVGPALAAATLRHVSFRGLFLAASAFYALFFAIVLRFVRAIPVAPPAPGAPLASAMGALRRPTVFAWFAAFVLVFAAHTISMGNMSLFVVKDLGGDASHVGVIFSLAPLFELPFMLYFGLLATRTDSARLIRAAVALAVVYYGFLSLARAPWHVYPLQFLSAAIVAITGGVAISFFQDKLPGQPGAATNIYSNAMRIGSTSGFLLFGTLAARFGHRGAYVGCAALTATALAMTLTADRTRGALGRPGAA